jgi:O-antigen ligase
LVLLLAYVAIAPVPYGAITRGGTLCLELFAFTMAALLFLDRPRLTRVAGVAVSLVALLAIALLGVAQTMPLPVDVLGIVSPVSAEVARDTATTLHAFGRPSPPPRISIAPLETIDTIILTLAFLALFVSTVLLLRSRSRRRLFVMVFLGSAVLHVLIATATRGMFASPEDSTPGRLHGAFVNPNHFAGYLLLALGVAFGVLWREVLHTRDRIRHTERGRLFESRFIQLSLRVVLWGIIAAGIGLTQSRGAILVAVIVTVVMLSIALAHPRLRSRRWSYTVAGVGVVAAAIGFAILAVRQQPIIRFLGSDPRDPASDLRLNLWRLSFEAWRRFPIFGSGLGTYREAFRRVQPRDLNYLVEFAHSDPLQLLVTGGAIGFTFGVVAFVTVLVALIRHWRKEQRREESAFLLAAFGAILAISLHGMVEFNLSIPAIPATLACVAGLGWASAHSESEHEERTRLRLVVGDP